MTWARLSHRSCAGSGQQCMPHQQISQRASDSRDSTAPGSPDHLVTLRVPIDQDSLSISGALSTLECLEPTEIAGKCHSSGTKNDNRTTQVPTAPPTMAVTDGSSA